MKERPKEGDPHCTNLSDRSSIVPSITALSVQSAAFAPNPCALPHRARAVLRGRAATMDSILRAVLPYPRTSGFLAS